MDICKSFVKLTDCKSVLNGLLAGTKREASFQQNMEALNQGKPEFRIEQTIISPLTTVKATLIGYWTFNAYGGLEANIPDGTKLIVTSVGNGGYVNLTEGQSATQPIGTGDGYYSGTRTATWNVSTNKFTVVDSRLGSYRNGSIAYAMLK